MAKAAAAKTQAPGPSLSLGDGYPVDVEVITPAYDLRPVTPAEVLTHPNLKNIGAIAAADLADEVAERLLELLPQNREPWRQEYTERLPGWGDEELILARFPIENLELDADGYGVPAVTLAHGLVDSSTAVEKSTYRVRGRCRKALYRDRGWLWTTRVADAIRPDELPGHETSDYSVGPYWAGYLMPGQLGSGPEGPRLDTPAAPVKTWQAATAYGVKQSTAYGDDRGSFVMATDRTAGVVFECTVAGTSGGTEPTWNVAIGAETAEAGGPTWTTRDASELPRIVRSILWKMADMIWRERKGACKGSEWGEVKMVLSMACI